MTWAIDDMLYGNDRVGKSPSFNPDNIVKGKVKVVKQLFPKPLQQTDNDFKILSVEPISIEEGDVEVNYWGNFVIKGNAPEIDMTESYTVTLKEVYDEKWGKQYEIIYIGTPMDLEDENSQKIFLSKILTDNQFKALYETFDNPFEIIQSENVQALTQCKGIGVKTAIKLIEKYKSTIDYSEAYVELDNYGLTPRIIEKLVDAYGSPNLVVQKVKENPYILSYEVDGIGFKKADDIALKSGIGKNSPFRIKAFIKSFLKEQAYNGNSYIHPSELFGQLLDTLGLERGNPEVDEVLKNTLYEMYDKGDIWYNDDRTQISLKSIYTLEQNIANELIRILTHENEFVYEGWEEVIAETEKRQGWEFTQQQREGIEVALKNQVVMITGYGGTGKTSIVSGMLDVLYKKYGYTFAQCALSGKAGARMAEVTGEEGYTIHRLLGYSPWEGYKFHDKNPLPYDIIIVDELSMVGADLFFKLIRAIKDGAKLIMLCDIGQLESIGMGNIAKDIIDSGVIPTVRLTEIHRQAKKSAIVTESLKVRKSEQLTPKGYVGTEVRGELQDLLMDIYDTKDLTAERIIQHFKENLSKVDNILELQVIVPMKNRGDSCTFALNSRLQEIYNPYDGRKKEVKVSISKDKFYILREGDKVINTKNNYKTFNLDDEITCIFNGDNGIIREIDDDAGIMIIEFQRTGDVIVPHSSWSDIELAYAITCHKSQGSEYHTVITGMDYSAFTLLSKEFVYTAITRAKKKCILCAENNALRYAIKTSNVSVKRTFLKEFLKKGIDKVKK